MEKPNNENKEILKDGYNVWKEYRKELTESIKEPKKLEPVDKKELVESALKIGIKPTARLYNLAPKTVRYWVNKYKN